MSGSGGHQKGAASLSSKNPRFDRKPLPFVLCDEDIKKTLTKTVLNYIQYLIMLNLPHHICISPDRIFVWVRKWQPATGPASLALEPSLKNAQAHLEQHLQAVAAGIAVGGSP